LLSNCCSHATTLTPLL